ncbi:thermonuclease family protein [Sulfobacillus acidophilus]|uniref:Thermonuclease family protein n=1 Tax=Sulfobacillus acidophilus TaxID=53633 RepID=A0ABS3AWD3_9FIRM|nr:thermonuclease family protein [Sulfobacillus acidophilus]
MQKNFTLAILFLTFLAFNSYTQASRTKVYLNGVPATAYFNDGDTFRVLSGEYKGKRARLVGFNTLETYGPVHSWGMWQKTGLLNIAKLGTKNARKGIWHCNLKGGIDTYGRMLWNCQDLAEDQIRKGLAHAFSVDKNAANESLLEIQQAAIKNKVGMWEHGVPNYILTSAHSLDERPSATRTYNRFISTKDGSSFKYYHSDVYEECTNICHIPTKAEEEVNEEADIPSCMVYVNFKRRYGRGRAECLK